MIQERKKRNSSKTNLIISVVFHSLLVIVVFFFAAREGLVGKRLKALTATLVPKEKKPEPPKEKPVEHKAEPPKVATAPKPAAVPQPKAETTAPPPAQEAVATAPPAMVLPNLNFEGGKEVIESADPNAVYKGLVEAALRSRWHRPEDMADDQYAAEVQLTIDQDGDVVSSKWLKGSGDRRWDDSVKLALSQTKTINHKPPKGFPTSVIVKFDVQSEAATGGLELSTR